MLKIMLIITIISFISLFILIMSLIEKNIKNRYENERARILKENKILIKELERILK